MTFSFVLPGILALLFATSREPWVVVTSLERDQAYIAFQEAFVPATGLKKAMRGFGQLMWRTEHDRADNTMVATVTKGKERRGFGLTLSNRPYIDPAGQTLVMKGAEGESGKHTYIFGMDTATTHWGMLIFGDKFREANQRIARCIVARSDGQASIRYPVSWMKIVVIVGASIGLLSMIAQ